MVRLHFRAKKDIMSSGVQYNVNCPHCVFLFTKLYPNFESFTDMITDKEYEIFNKVFLYLHNGNEFCDRGIKLTGIK